MGIGAGRQRCARCRSDRRAGRRFAPDRADLYRLETIGLKLLDSISNYEDIVISTGYVFKKTWVAANRDVPVR